MAMPNFTAELSLYRTTRSYRSARHAWLAVSELAPQQNFACLPDDSACACHGLSDCIDCSNLGHCTGSCQCDDSLTCVCTGPGL